MKPNKGLARNYKAVDQPAGTISFGKNGARNQKGASQNERGFSVCSAKVPYTIHGIVETDQDPIIFSTDDTYSAIGFYNEQQDKYTSIFNDAFLDFKLGFKKDHPIQGEARRNYRNEIEVAWVDGIKPRFLNTSSIGNDLKDFALFPEYNVPDIQLSSSLAGSLEVGTYFVALKYGNQDGTETRYATISSPVSLRSDNYLASGMPSSKGLKVKLTGLDMSYNKFTLALIKRVNGVTTAVELQSRSISKADMEMSILSAEGTDITLEEVLIPPAFYIQAGSITQLNDVLWLADVEEANTINLQRIANKVQVKIESQVRKIELTGASTDIVDGTYRTLKHGEVYAFYLVGILSSGLKTSAFHVPGIAPDDSLTGGEWVNSRIYEAFKVTDTVGSLKVTSETSVEMKPGIWQNKDEQYPDHSDYKSDGLVGPVRHHRMPSTGFMKLVYKDKLSSDYTYGVNCLDFLGVQFENVIIPEELKASVVGWEIYYAKRTYDNSLISGQGCLTFPSKLFKEGVPGFPANIGQAIIKNSPAASIYWTTGGNFKAKVLAKNDTSGGAMTLWPSLSPFVRVHSPELTANRPSIQPNMLKLNYSLRGAVSSIQADEDAISFMIDYTSGKGTHTMTGGANTYRLLGQTSYLPNMGIVGNTNNLKGEPTFIGKIEGGEVPISYSELSHRISGTGQDVLPAFEETFIVDVVTMKDNLYSSFETQEIVRIGHIEKASQTKSQFRYGGDCFICIDSYYSHGLIDGIETGQVNLPDINWDEKESHKDRMDATDGTKVLRLFLVESTMNLWQRYKDPALSTSAFYPQTSSTDFMKNMDRTLDNNMYGYDKSASSTADLTQGLKPYSVDDVNITKSPFRIIRSQPQSREGKRNNWKQFAALDYFETQKDMGPIVNLQGYDERLLIHHRNALFMTQDKTTLQGDILNVTLGTGDLFRFPPKPGKPSKLGYGGTQHRLAAVLTDFGYCFADAQTGEIFVLNEQGLQGIGGDMSNFLQRYLRLQESNVFTGKGITIGYDYQFKRMLLSVKQGDTSFTLSYNTQDKQWAYFHDYVPDYYFHTRKNIYALKQGTFYQMNTGERGLYFDQSAPKPFFLDVVFNNDKPMLLNSVNWRTEVTSQQDEDSNPVALQNETFTAITIWNDYQCTGRIPLDKLNRNNRATHQVWNFNDFRNLVLQDGTAFLENLFKDFSVKPEAIKELPWYEKGLLQGHYFIVRFEYQNNQNKQITVHEVDLSVSPL